MTGRRQQPADTEERIIAAAESLFMDRGYAATSLRMITARARVNLAAVHYHFGSKEALIRRVFERRLGPLNSARVACLDQLEAETEGRPPSIERIIEAIVAPALQVGSARLAGGAQAWRLLGRAFTEPADRLGEVLPARYRQVVIRLRQALMRALPNVPEQELTWRMHFMFGALSHTMAGSDALKFIAPSDLDGVDDPDSIIRRLIPFLCAGLQAPSAGSRNLARKGGRGAPAGKVGRLSGAKRPAPFTSHLEGKRS